MNECQSVVDRYLTHRTRADRDAVIGAHLYLCKRGARKFRRPESDPADLEQVAAIGLLKATDTYVAERTTPFEAYAWLLIVGELMHYVRDCESAVRIPRRLRALDRRYVAEWETIAAQQHAEPTPLQLAHALGVTLATVEQIRANRSGQVDVDRPGWNRLDALPAHLGALSLDERLTLLAAIDQLNERERTIVLGTFGAGLSQGEVAHRLGLSQSQVSKLLSRALSKLSERVA